MFQVKKHESSNKTIRMSNELVDKLEQLAVKSKVSLNKVVIQCCEYALAHLENDEKLD